MANYNKEQEQLFNELIAVKFLYRSRIKIFKQLPDDSKEKSGVDKDLQALRERLNKIEKRISGYGDSFLDVYDHELMVPLTEAGIIKLREELREVRKSLKLIKS